MTDQELADVYAYIQIRTAPRPAREHSDTESAMMLRLRSLLWLTFGLSGAIAGQTTAPRVPRYAAEFDELFQRVSNWGRWGEDDQLGSPNLVTSPRRKQAIALAKDAFRCHWPIPWDIGNVIRFAGPGVFEDQITATDPKALLEPMSWSVRIGKASPPNDEPRLSRAQRE